MLGMRLVHLIEKHSQMLSQELAQRILQSERTSDFRRIPAEDLQLAATELYRNLEEWLMRKTDSDIAGRFRKIAARRAAEGIRLHEFVLALMLTRDHLWHFIRREALADSIVELHGELELYQLLNQFFDRAIYYAILGYGEAARESSASHDLARARDLAVSIGLMQADRSISEP